MAEPSAARVPPIRIVVVDDEPLVRQGLRLILDGEPDFVVVGEADDGPARSAPPVS